LQFYPNGDNEESNGFISLFLYQLEQVNIGFTGKFKFGVQGKSEEEYLMEDCSERSSEEFKEYQGYGYGKLLSIKELLDDSKTFINDGGITLICEVT
jgi:hypothetical protein